MTLLRAALLYRLHRKQTIESPIHPKTGKHHCCNSPPLCGALRRRAPATPSCRDFRKPLRKDVLRSDDERCANWKEAGIHPRGVTIRERVRCVAACDRVRNAVPVLTWPLDPQTEAARPARIMRLERRTRGRLSSSLLVRVHRRSHGYSSRCTGRPRRSGVARRTSVDGITPCRLHVTHLVQLKGDSPLRESLGGSQRARGGFPSSSRGQQSWY
eukprot:scaffold174637_cov31-Tisochrysis_lutea.AAC.2